MKNKRIINTIIIFLSVFVVSAGLALLLKINNGLLPGVMLGSGTALWYYKFYKREGSDVDV